MDATSSTYVKSMARCGMPKTLPMVDMSAPVCCSPVAAGPVGDEAALEIALRLKALADPVRVKLVSLLFSSDAGEVCSCDLASAVGLSESTVSHHLSQLRRAGLVESERRGMNVYHRPRRDVADRSLHGAGPELLPLERRSRRTAPASEVGVTRRHFAVPDRAAKRRSASCRENPIRPTDGQRHRSAAVRPAAGVRKPRPDPLDGPRQPLRQQARELRRIVQRATLG